MGQEGVRRSRLTSEEVAPIGAYGAKASWPPGFQLYQRGVAADGVFIVLDGHVVLRNKIKVGRGFVPVIATAGQTFGSEGLSPNSQYVTDAGAPRKKLKTMFLSGAQFRAVIRERPAHVIPLLSQIMSERAYLLEKLHELAALNVDQRLISTLSHLSTDRSFTTDDGRLKLENNHPPPSLRDGRCDARIDRAGAEPTRLGWNRREKGNDVPDRAALAPRISSWKRRSEFSRKRRQEFADPRGKERAVAIVRLDGRPARR